MLGETNERKNMIESFSNKVALWIQQRTDMGEIEYLKIKLGAETILINATKGVVVYGLAIMLNVFLQTLILHSAYFAVRRVSFGLHAKSSINCTIISVVMFVVVPYFIQYVTIDNYFVLLLFLLCINCLYYFAPADTEKHPLIGGEKRRKLRNQSVVVCIILMVTALTVPILTIKILITAGVTLQVIHILPITYKLLQRSYDNYEKYETEIIE